ncbi:MAG: hypothetical protein EG826_06655 [Deltaproteobacteria bacterium]|nr:hypothetical protein [Deltaproteobacteria bacterium]
MAVFNLRFVSKRVELRQISEEALPLILIVKPKGITMNDERFIFDPDEHLMYEIIVDKLDAARRQLESAIEMFFEDGDVVSLHTLISAAHGVVYDLASKHGIEGSIKDSPLVSAENKAAFIQAIHLPQNFFKHAKTDSGNKLVFRYQVSPFYLFDALRLYVLLAGAATETMRVFLVWFQLRYPDLFCYPAAEEDLREIRQDITDPEIFKSVGKILLKDRTHGKRP